MDPADSSETLRNLAEQLRRLSPSERATVLRAAAYVRAKSGERGASAAVDLLLAAGLLPALGEPAPKLEGQKA